MKNQAAYCKEYNSYNQFITDTLRFYWLYVKIEIFTSLPELQWLCQGVETVKEETHIEHSAVNLYPIVNVLNLEQKDKDKGKNG